MRVMKNLPMIIYDDVDSLERETIPLENVEYKLKASEVREVESGAAVYIS
jgi:hypothetical protein